MTATIAKHRDRFGNMRFYVLPVETEEAFSELIAFVSTEFCCNFDSPDEGLGTVVRKTAIEGKDVIFVLSDATGAQFYSEAPEGIGVAEMIAKKVEKYMKGGAVE